MRAVEIVKPFSNNGMNFEAGKRMIMAEDSEGQLRALFGENMGMSYPIESF